MFLNIKKNYVYKFAITVTFLVLKYKTENVHIRCVDNFTSCTNLYNLFSNFSLCLRILLRKSKNMSNEVLFVHNLLPESRTCRIIGVYEIY